MPPASPLLALPSLAGDLPRIERALREAVTSVDAELAAMAAHLIPAGGKRLRPVMTVTTALTGNDVASDDVVMGGVAVELVHLGSLYHDDVMDEAATRRGIESVNARWGNLRAILAGDFLLARASEIAASLGTEVAALLARTIGRLCEGQVSELRTAFQATRTTDEYFASISGKTASLFAAACRIGGIVGGLDREAVDAATRYGQAFGMVFQIVDDVLDLVATEEQLGKPAGHDLVEGVYTLPVILTLDAGGSLARRLRALLGQPLHGDDLDTALSLVRANGGVPGALGMARRFADDAAEAARALGDSPAARALAEAPYALLDGVR